MEMTTCEVKKVVDYTSRDVTIPMIRALWGAIQSGGFSCLTGFPVMVPSLVCAHGTEVKDSSINNMDELMVILTNGIIPFWVKVIF
jgi:hypothetical protein